MFESSRSPRNLFRFTITPFRRFLRVSQLSPLVFPRTFSISVSIFTCALLFSVNHRQDHILFHRFFSRPPNLALVPAWTGLFLGSLTNPKSTAQDKHLDIFFIHSFDLDSKTNSILYHLL